MYIIKGHKKGGSILWGRFFFILYAKGRGRQVAVSNLGKTNPSNMFGISDPNGSM